MRVLQVYRDAFALMPGGIERHVRDLSGALGETAGVDVEVLVGARRASPQRWREGPVGVRAVAELGRVGGVPLAPGIPLRAAASRADVVHVHGPNPAGEIALPLARAARVATWHCDPYRLRRAHGTYAAAVVPALASCHRVIASSQRLVERSDVMSRLADRRPGAIRVVPYGIDATRFSPPTVATRGGDGSGCAVVLFVGRLRPYKGLEVLVRALARIDATLVVVGDGPEHPMLESLGTNVLGNRLRLLGQLSDAALVDAYRAADVLCLPSTSASEAFGMVLLEAMACGLPVVSTEVGTATSLVNRHGETGLVVPPGDPAALAEALQVLLADPDLSAAMGRAGRAHVCRHHDLAVTSHAVFEVYQEALDEAAA